MIISKIIVLLILASLITMITLSLKKDVSKNEINREYINKNNINYNQQNNNISNYNQEKDNNDKIDKDYIMSKYGNNLIYPLMGYRNHDNEFYSFYINKNDAMDIKLPFEFLSPIKTMNSDNKDIFFELNVDDNYEHFLIHSDDQSLFFGDKALGKSSDSEDLLNSISYEKFVFYDYNISIKYDVIREYKNHKDRFDQHFESSETLINLIETYDLDSQSITEYYIALIKRNQPSFDEMIDILIKFEKSKEEIKRINLINKNERLNKMLENSKYRDDRNFDNMDKELLSLINNNNNNNN